MECYLCRDEKERIEEGWYVIIYMISYDIESCE